MKTPMMFTRLVVLAALAAGAICGQGQEVVSVQPLVTEKEAILDDGLIGDWGDLKISRTHGNEYEAIGFSPMPMHFRLIRLGKDLFADISGSLPQAVYNQAFWAPPVLPMHILGRIQQTADHLSFDFLTEAAANILLKVNDSPHVALGGECTAVILTGSSDELKRFVLRYSQLEDAMGDGHDFTRTTTASEPEQETLGCQGGLSLAGQPLLLSVQPDCLNHWTDWVLRPWFADWWRLSATASVTVEYQLENGGTSTFELTPAKPCTGVDPRGAIFDFHPVQAMHYRTATPGTVIKTEFGLGEGQRGSLPLCVEPSGSKQPEKR